MREDLLIRFSQNHPCWSRDLLFRAGEILLLDENLDYLLTQGLLIKNNNLYFLSDAGRAEFEKISDELFLYERPGNEPKDFKRCALATELWLELERCNLQKWGLKKYLFRPELAVRPKLKLNKIFEFNNNKINWLYLNKIKNFIDNYYLGGRDINKNLSKLAEWLKLERELFTPDLFLIINYDFKNYLEFKSPEQDELKLVNTDRFIFIINKDAEACINEISKFHRFIIEQRYLRLPGYFDLDCHEQGSATWLIFLTESQNDAVSLQNELKNFGASLIEPVMPCEIWTLSLESLRQCEAGRDVIWEVVPKFALPVCRDI